MPEDRMVCCSQAIKFLKTRLFVALIVVGYP